MVSSWVKVSAILAKRTVSLSCEAVALLAKAEVTLAGLAGDVLVAVEDDLRAKRRVTGHLDGDVAPLWVEDVERVVIDVRPLLFQVLDHSTC
jgi:hypothetical protein